MKAGMEMSETNQKTSISRRTAALMLGSCLVGTPKVFASTDPLTAEIYRRHLLLGLSVPSVFGRRDLGSVEAAVRCPSAADLSLQRRNRDFGGPRDRSRLLSFH